MANERIEIEVDVNTRDAAAAVDGLTEAEKRLRNELGAVQQAATRTAQGMQQVTTSARTSKAATDAVTQASRRSARGFAEQINMVSEMSLGFGALSPKLRELTIAFAGAGNNAVQLAGSMGPLGIAIGLLGGLVPSLVSSLASGGEASREMAQGLDELTRSARTSEDAFRDLIDRLREYDRQQGLRAGSAGIDPTRDALAEARLTERGRVLTSGNAERALRARLRGSGLEDSPLDVISEWARGHESQRGENALSNQVREVERLSREAAEATRNVRELEEGLRMAQANAGSMGFQPGQQRIGLPEDSTRRIARETSIAGRNAERAAHRRSGGRDSRDYLTEAYERQAAAIAEVTARNEERFDREKAGVEAAAEYERAALEETERAKAQQHEREVARIIDLTEKRKEAARRELEELERVKEKRRSHFESTRDEINSVLSPALTGMYDAMKQVMAGSESAEDAFKGMLSGFLDMLGQRAALEAAMQFASAIASFATQDYAGGALHLAAGAAFTGVAVVAGAASVAVAPAAAMAPAEPTVSGSDSGRRSGDIIINWNSPVITAGTRAELGRELATTIQAGSRLAA